MKRPIISPAPLSGATIKSKRTTAGIAGHVLCAAINKSRAWLCTVERGYLTPPPEELTRIDAALNQLIKSKLAQLYAATA